MANEKISAMAAATTPLAGAELATLVQGGVNVQTSVANLTTGRSVNGASFVVTGSTVPANGVYLPGTNTVGIATNSTLRLSVSTTAVTSTLPYVAPLGAVGTPSHTFVGDLDTGMWSSAANTLDFSTGSYRALQLGYFEFSTDFALITPNAGFVTYGAGGANSDVDIKIIPRGIGSIRVPATITAAATTGAQTINKTAGSVNLAGSATSLVVTNSQVTANSTIMLTVATNDATIARINAVPATGSFTINAGVAPTAETRINFLVINKGD